MQLDHPAFCHQPDRRPPPTLCFLIGIADRGETKLMSSVPLRTIGVPQLGSWTAIVLGVALAISPTPLLAEIRVSGSLEAVTIEARDTPVEEVLAALSPTFDMNYQSSIDLDKRLYGTYVGPLSRMVTRLLQGDNFVSED
jgi:hypothetical protein